MTAYDSDGDLDQYIWKVKVGKPSGHDDNDDDPDCDADDRELRRVLLKVSRPAFIASINAGIASGAIDPKKLVTVTLVSGNHVIGSDTIRVHR